MSTQLFFRAEIVIHAVSKPGPIGALNDKLVSPASKKTCILSCELGTREQRKMKDVAEGADGDDAKLGSETAERAGTENRYVRGRVGALVAVAALPEEFDDEEEDDE